MLTTSNNLRDYIHIMTRLHIKYSYISTIYIYKYIYIYIYISTIYIYIYIYTLYITNYTPVNVKENIHY